MLASLKEALRARALELGFGLVGFTTAEPLADVHQTRWTRWRAEDKAGAMRYLMREAPRRTHPRDMLPEAQSVVVVAAGYYAGDHPAPPHSAEGEAEVAGKVARYAWGEDYHHVMRERLNALTEFAAAEAARLGIREPVLARPCVDSAPLDERALAVRAGLGFIGKNTLLLHPEHGSWMLLGVLLLSLELPPDTPGLRKVGRETRETDQPVSCGGCTRCIDACPTAALEAPFRLDPRRCISYLTIEQREAIDPALTRKMQGWAFGCDICQEVCPLNAAPLAQLIPELGATHGVGPHLSQSTLQATPTGKAFQRRWKHTPLARPGLKNLLRNLGAISRGGS